MTVPEPCDLQRLQRGVVAPWRSFDVATVNGNAVRLRVTENTAAHWHVHGDSDELFQLLSGTVLMETEHGAHEIRPGQVLVVPAETRHRARVEGRAVLPVVDSGYRDAV